MKDDYNANSHYLAHTFLFKMLVGRPATVSGGHLELREAINWQILFPLHRTLVRDPSIPDGCAGVGVFCWLDQACIHHKVQWHSSRGKQSYFTFHFISLWAEGYCCCSLVLGLHRVQSTSCTRCHLQPAEKCMCSLLISQTTGSHQNKDKLLVLWQSISMTDFSLAIFDKWSEISRIQQSYTSWPLLLDLLPISTFGFAVLFQAQSDHFNLVSRRLGFIPLPLGAVVCSTFGPHIQYLSLSPSALRLHKMCPLSISLYRWSAWLPSQSNCMAWQGFACLSSLTSCE